MPIIWKETDHGGCHGYLGKAHVFSIYWDAMQGSDSGYKLGVDLPGMKQYPDFKRQNIDEIKEFAEKKVFRHWLKITGLQDGSGTDEPDKN